MKHLANISQFERLLNPTHTSNGFAVLHNVDAAETIMGTGTPADPNVPEMPPHGKYNSLSAALLPLQVQLFDYFKRIKPETDKFAAGIAQAGDDIKQFISIIKHPAARSYLGLTDESLLNVSKRVRDFYDSLKQQVHDVVYAPLADLCDEVTTQIEAKGDMAPQQEEGFGWFGLRPTLRSQFKKRLKEALAKGEITKSDYKEAKHKGSADWKATRAEYERYRTAADDILRRRGMPGKPVPEIAQILKMYGYDLKDVQQSNMPDELRAVLGDILGMADANKDYFSSMGTQKWRDQNSGVLGRLLSAIRRAGIAKKTQSDKNQTSAPQKDKEEYRDTTFGSTFNPADYATAADLIKAQGFEKTQAFVDGVDAAKSRKERVSQDQWKLYQRVAKAVKSDPRYHK